MFWFLGIISKYKKKIVNLYKAHSEIVVDGKSDISEKNKNSISKFLGNGNGLSKSIKPNSSITCLEETNLKNHAYCHFNKYPVGIVNPAFSGMLLCELSQDHLLNDFPINKYHEIRNGIIIQNTKAYVFTSIRNDNIHSYLKILLRKKEMKCSITPTIAATMLTKYVQQQSQETIIPCIKTIQDNLCNILGLTESSFSDDHITYFILLHRIYLLIFMLRYNMPL